jgi:DNA repair photolyase
MLAKANERVPVDLAMSIAIYDDELQQAVEPGTPSTAARLATVTAARDYGLPVTVFLMPILPYLTDSRAHLDDALERVAASGATSVTHTALHLRPGTREWYMQWLEREHPDLVPRYEEMYKFGSYAPKAYRKWLADKFRPLARKHGLNRGDLNPTTGTVRSRGLRPAAQYSPEPTLF